MSSECTFTIDSSQDVLELHGVLKRHVIMFSPPYPIARLMSQYIVNEGRSVKVVIHHASRDVQIIEGSVSRHVLRTAIMAFQTHRISAPTPPRSSARRHLASAARRPTGAATQQDCPICFDTIHEHEACALPCMHAFHSRCIDPWLYEHNTCPVCRHPV